LTGATIGGVGANVVASTVIAVGAAGQAFSAAIASAMGAGAADAGGATGICRCRRSAIAMRDGALRRSAIRVLAPGLPAPGLPATWFLTLWFLAPAFLALWFLALWFLADLAAGLAANLFRGLASVLPNRRSCRSCIGWPAGSAVVTCAIAPPIRIPLANKQITMPATTRIVRIASLRYSTFPGAIGTDRNDLKVTQLRIFSHKALTKIRHT
jgi:hypothetical protein